MKSLLLAGFALLALCQGAMAQAPGVVRQERGNLVTENVPETPAGIRDRIQQYLNTRAASFSSWSPDGRSILISTRFGETNQIHRVDAPMGARRQLTFFPEPTGGGYRPGQGRTILFAKDKGGDENFQLYLMDEATGGYTRFTDGTSRNTSAVYSLDGERLAWSRSTKDSPRYQIFTADGGAPKEPALVYEDEGAWAPRSFSPDKSKLLISRGVSVNESYLWVLDLQTRQKTQVNPSSKQISYDGAEFSRDGRSILTVSDEDSDFARLVRIDLASNTKTILSGDLKWDVEAFSQSRDGRLIAYSFNEAGASKVRIISAATGASVPAPDLPLGVISGLGFSPDGTKLALSLSAASTTGDVWVWDLSARKLIRWTESETGGIQSSQFITPSLISYPTFDQIDGKQRMIQAYMYKPQGAGPHPVLLYPHGGPESQTRPSFSGFFQFLAKEMGIAVIAPNVRGSTGYGRAFVNLDNGKLREDSVKDMGALIDWVATQRDLDAKRVGVYGGSYGGYMAYAVMITYADRVVAGISAVGISNFVTFLENTSGYRRDLRRVEYGDERDADMRAFQEKISPLTNAARITKPMFIIQGANDPRVPLSEAAQMLKAIRANGADAWYMMAKDEGHGFAKKVNRDAQNEAIAAFLAAKLVGKPVN
ncbi:MAG TPA: S9 family peptidase [Alphaproteobacteria bacterium]|nr:S9 family peptidase [Alphaproteobacteria bacterium]HAJ46990.1 S9 family peptidase [Alphaproteobacteria bacterium]